MQLLPTVFVGLSHLTFNLTESIYSAMKVENWFNAQSNLSNLDVNFSGLNEEVSWAAN